MFQILITLLLSILPTCAHEGDNMCTWDASVQGNGQGTSYIAISDDLIIEF